jgi:citrate synthase
VLQRHFIDHGSLPESLHDGASGRIAAMVNATGARSRVRDWMHDALERRQRIMGMGHRVYRIKDARPRIIDDFLERPSAEHDDFPRHDILKRIGAVSRERTDREVGSSVVTSTTTQAPSTSSRTSILSS